MKEMEPLGHPLALGGLGYLNNLDPHALGNESNPIFVGAVF